MGPVNTQGCLMIRSKACFKCGIEKPLDDFYKHPMMKDGHLGKCKECAKKDVNTYRLLNLEKIRAYDRARASLPHRREMNTRATNKWRSEDRRRLSCHLKVKRAIKKGVLVRQPCQTCGEVNSLAHHEDYDKPLDVMWLCQPCHKVRHKELKELCN